MKSVSTFLLFRTKNVRAEKSEICNVTDEYRKADRRIHNELQTIVSHFLRLDFVCRLIQETRPSFVKSSRLFEQSFSYLTVLMV
jgi:hypothetical protein